MAASKKILALICLPTVVILACSVTINLGTQPSGTSTSQVSGLDQVSTMVAQTLQAFTQQAISATPTATLPPTNTPVPPTLTVNTDTNCRAGPGTSYGIVITLHPGTIAYITGKDTLDNFWIIDAPNYPGTTCWISGQYTTISGDTNDLVEPPTPAVAIPYTLSEPRGLRVSCTSQTVSSGSSHWKHNASEWTVIFRWKDTDANQTGVRVYRNGWHIATLGKHATSYTDTFLHHDWHDEVTYGVQAFNSSEISSIVTITVNHCH